VFGKGPSKLFSAGGGEKKDIWKATGCDHVETEEKHGFVSTLTGELKGRNATLTTSYCYDLDNCCPRPGVESRGGGFQGALEDYLKTKKERKDRVLN